MPNRDPGLKILRLGDHGWNPGRKVLTRHLGSMNLHANTRFRERSGEVRSDLGLVNDDQNPDPERDGKATDWAP